MVFYGYSGNDSLTGSAFNDVLWGALGNDTLTGQGGNDQFYYTDLLEGTDQIKTLRLVKILYFLLITQHQPIQGLDYILMLMLKVRLLI